MKISIITVILNPDTISLMKTFDSICIQEYRDYEYIIVDGMSCDPIKELLSDWANKYKWFKYVSEKDLGIYDAMNKGTKIASGDYVLFLGAGDCLFSKFTLQNIDDSGYMGLYDVIYGFCKYIDYNGNITGESKKKLISWKYKMMFYSLCHQCVIGKRDLLINYPFDLEYSIVADQDWIMKMYKNGRKFKFLDIPVAYFLNGGISTQISSRQTVRYEKDEVHRKYYPVFAFIRRLVRDIKITIMEKDVLNHE